MLTIAYKYKNVFHFPSSPTSTAIWHRKKRGKGEKKSDFPPHFLFNIFLYDTDFNEILNTWHSCVCVCLCDRLSVFNPLNISQGPPQIFSHEKTQFQTSPMINGMASKFYDAKHLSSLDTSAPNTKLSIFSAKLLPHFFPPLLWFPSGIFVPLRQVSFVSFRPNAPRGCK